MTSARILIVEDARQVTHDVRNILQGLGYAVTGIAAADAAALVQTAAEQQAVAALSVRETFLRGVIDHAPALLWLADLQGHRVFFSKGWFDFTGITFEANLGASWLAHVHPDDVPGVIAMRSGALHTLQPVQVAYRLRRYDGVYHRVLDVAEPYSDPAGTVLGFVGSVIDITEREQTEEEWQRAYAELEQRMQERTTALQHANHVLQVEIVARQLAEGEQQRLLERLITVQEEERHRVARELHDQLGQTISALMLQLKALEVRYQSADLQPLQSLATTLAREVHDLGWMLRPPALESKGIEAVLADYVEDWARDTGVIADFFQSGFSGQRFPLHLETTLYRIVQESLTNVRKHAQASRVSVLLDGRRDHVLAIVEDTGRGFDVEAVQAVRDRSGGLGLIGMSERAALVGGTVEIESTPGVGTTVFARLPVPPIARERLPSTIAPPPGEMPS